MRAAVLLLVLLSFLVPAPLIAATADDQGPPYKGVWISTPFPSHSVAVGEPIRIELKVHNAGLPPQNVALSVSQAPEGWSSIFLGDGRPIRSVFVDPDSTAELTLRLVPPEGVQTGTHRFQLAAASSEGDYTLPVEISFDDVLPAKLALETNLPALRGSPTSNFQFEVTVENESGRETIARLDAAAPPGFQVSFKERFGSSELTSLPIKARESRDLTVEIDPPPNLPAGTYQVAIHAITEDGNAQKVLSLDITGRAELSLTGPDDRLSGSARAGDETPLTLLVANRGSAAAQNIEFSAFEPSGWNVTFEPETLDMLPAGENREIKALITPSSEAIAGDYMVTMRANGDGISDSSEFRITVQTSTLWGIVGVLVIAAAMVVLSLAVVRFGRR